MLRITFFSGVEKDKKDQGSDTKLINLKKKNLKNSITATTISPLFLLFNFSSQDPGTKCGSGSKDEMNADPCGSGSTTLLTSNSRTAGELYTSMLVADAMLDVEFCLEWDRSLSGPPETT